MREKLDKEKPNLTAEERKQEITSYYKGLDSKEKALFKRMADKDKKRYTKEYDQWLKESYIFREMLYQQKQRKNEKCKIDYKFKQVHPKGYVLDVEHLKVPKRAGTAYTIFASDERYNLRSKMGHITFDQVQRAISVKFETLSKEDKKPYEIRASEDRRRYSQEMEAFRELGGKLPFEKKLEEEKKQAEISKKQTSELVFASHG